MALSLMNKVYVIGWFTVTLYILVVSCQYLAIIGCSCKDTI